MTISAQRWRENWRVIAPPGAVRVDLERSAESRRSLLKEAVDLPAGTPVVILTRAPRATSRSRHFAQAAGIALEREYLTFPSVTAPCHLIEDARASISLYIDTVLVAPPGKPYSRPLELCLSILRAIPSWRLVRRLAPGRALVGRRI
jgi:hypothetical protein